MTLEVATFSQLQTDPTGVNIAVNSDEKHLFQQLRGNRKRSFLFLYSQRGGKSAFPFFVFPAFIFPDKYCAFEAHVGQQTAEHGFRFPY